MQVTINNTHPDELIYPYVGKLVSDAHTTIVLFTSSRQGVCLLSTDSTNVVGDESYSWKESEFTRCSVTLT